MKKIYNKTIKNGIKFPNDNFWIKWRYEEILKAIKSSGISLNIITIAWMSVRMSGRKN